MWGVTSTTKGGNLSVNKRLQDAESHIHANSTEMKHSSGKYTLAVTDLDKTTVMNRGKQENNRR
jgi:hypothetical protein